ncbi:MAG: type II toxin-antitoxin system HicB family antitoxin [Nitrospira sp.]|nr:type II toxin-antitoxin system HicB family antitoxin [Nitrospira sp.]MDE0505161.1 type II toxin-antitoxin system HicB family antitoxin [Candidatus Poribacteria bacterium]
MAKAMQLAYPVMLASQEEGTLFVSFPDVPEALTEGPTEREALAEAEDCLIAALGGYINDRRNIPHPSPARGCPVVILPALVAAKLALYQAMREQGVNNVALAGQLGVMEGTVRRLLDLDHRSHIGQIEAALKIFGKRLVIAARAA